MWFCYSLLAWGSFSNHIVLLKCKRKTKCSLSLYINVFSHCVPLPLSIVFLLLSIFFHRHWCCFDESEMWNSSPDLGFLHLSLLKLECVTPLPAKSRMTYNTGHPVPIQPHPFSIFIEDILDWTVQGNS